MPVIKHSEEEKRFILTKHNITKRMEEQQVTDLQMAQYVGICEKTFKDKRRHPELFKYEELIRVFKRLHFPDCEILEGMR